MAFISNPKSLYIIRLIQLAFAIGVLVLVSYAGTHHGWWSNIQGGIALGVIAFLFTTVLAIHTVITHHRSNPFSATGKIQKILRIVLEILTCLLWIAAAGLMLRPKDGCEVHVNIKNRWQCNDDHGNFRAFESERPNVTWNLAIAFSLVEVVSFILSILLVFKDDRTNKVSGGVSYA